MGNRIYTQQYNFSSGTVTTKLSGRQDLEQYVNSVKESNNLLTTKYGSLTSRPGTKYLNDALVSTKRALKTFKYSDNTAYAVEFGTGKIRFFYNKAVVTDSTDFTNGTFTSDISGWTDNSAGTGAISFNTDHMDIIGGGAGNEAIATAELPYLGITQYTVTVDVGTTTVEYLVGTTSGASDIASGSLTTGSAKTFSFTQSTAGTVYVSFRQAGSATSTIDNVSLSSPEYVIDHDYGTTDPNELQVTQSFDVMYIVHKNHAPKKLVRYGNDDWALETVSFTDGPYLDVNSTPTTVTPGATSGSGVTFTFSSTVGINNNLGFSAADVGRLIRVKSGPDTTDSVKYTGDGTRTTFPIPFSYSSGTADIQVYVEAATGAWTLQTYTTHYTVNSLGQVVMGTAPASGAFLIIQRTNAGTGRWGWGTIASVTNSKVITVDIEDSFHGTNATTYWRLGAFYTGNYPVSASFHEQRLYLAGQGRWVWGSYVGDYENFQPDDADRKGNPIATSAVYFQLASLEANEIQGISSLVGLAVLSKGDVTGLFTDVGGIMSAESPPAPFKNGQISSSYIQPVVIGSTLYFPNFNRTALNAIKFTNNSFGFVPVEISTLAENLFTESPIIDMAYQELPTKVLWLLRADGRLISYTVQPELGVSAFMLHQVGGNAPVVQSIAAVPNSTDNDHLYLLTSRTINGSTAYHTEVMEDFFDNDSQFTDSKFLDCTAYYSGSATTSITGLDHLEGETVQVVTNEGVHPDRTVSSGAITLQANATWCAVGYYKERTVTLHPINVNLPNGSGRGSLKSVYAVYLDLYETSSCKAGIVGNQKEILFKETISGATNNLSLYSGIKKVDGIATNYSENTQVQISQAYALPLTINAIITKFEVTNE